MGGWLDRNGETSDCLDAGGGSIGGRRVSSGMAWLTRDIRSAGSRSIGVRNRMVLTTARESRGTRTWLLFATLFFYF